MKVGFYLNSPSMPDGDYSMISAYNPGIAGSEYEFLLVPFLLQQRDNGIDPYLLTNYKGVFPHKYQALVNNLDDCCQYCIDNSIEVLVIDIKYFSLEVLERYRHGLSVVIWAHNNVPYCLLDLFWKLPYIKKIVNCGREELELYRDHIATLKSIYIYNIFPFEEKIRYQSQINFEDNHNVVYMGSLIRAKGFHVLAKAWRTILVEIPDAQLYVIGSGRLYEKNAELGVYGIASREYEDEFVPYLLDEYGKIIPSVHFMGLLGKEKYEILSKCKVAVPNPTGNSECLPISAIEMQLMGCSITTISHPAYWDTVMNKKYLFRTEKELSSYIIKRLRSSRDNYDALYNFVSSKFGIEGNIQKWEYLFTSLDEISMPLYSGNKIILKAFQTSILCLKIIFPYFNRFMPFEVFLKKVKRHLSQQFWYGKDAV